MTDPSMFKLVCEPLTPQYFVKDLNMAQMNFRTENPKLGFDTSRPEKRIGNHVESKNINGVKYVFPKKYQISTEMNNNCQAALLQVKLYQTEEKLQAVKKKMLKQREAFAVQWKDLEEKEVQLKENFIKFNQFVEENQNKRIRAMKKLEDDKKLIKERTEACGKLMDEIAKMRDLKQMQDRAIKTYAIYERYIREICEVSQEFDSVNSVIARYDNLVAARKMAGEKQNKLMFFLEQAKASMMKLIEEKNFIIMGLNNQIANLQARYEHANIKALESEELVTQIKNNAVKQMEEIDTVKNSIWNVYVHMASSKKHPIKIKRENVEEQMMYINRTLTELNKVNKLIKKRTTKNLQK